MGTDNANDTPLMKTGQGDYERTYTPTPLDPKTALLVTRTFCWGFAVGAVVMLALVALMRNA